jgi:peroxiredoxin
VGPSLWQHLASAGNDERKIFIFAGCAVCFLLLRALRQSPPPEPESVTLDSQRADDSWDFEESPRPSVQNRARPAPNSYVARLIVPLSIGTPAPEFALPSVAGQTRSLQSLLEQGKTVLLVFSSPYCDPCRALQPMVRGWMQKYEESLNIVLVSRGTVQDNLSKQPNIEVSRVLLQRDFEVSEAYGCTATPAAVLVGANGLIQSDLVVGREAIGELISSAGRLSNVAAPSQTHGG